MDIQGSMKVDIPFYSCPTTGVVSGKICIFSKASIGVKTKTRGWVGKHRRGSSTVPLSLSFRVKGKAYTRRVVKGLGRKALDLNLSLRGKGTTKSVVSSFIGKGIVQRPVHSLTTRAEVLPNVYTTKDLSILLDKWGSFIPEISFPVFNQRTKDNFSTQDLIDIRVMKEYRTSHERLGDRTNWLVAKVFYEGCPCMVLVNEGWQGTHYPNRYILDRSIYNYMIAYLFNMIEADEASDLSGRVMDRVRVVNYVEVDIKHLPDHIQDLVHRLGAL